MSGNTQLSYSPTLSVDDDMTASPYAMNPQPSARRSFVLDLVAVTTLAVIFCFWGLGANPFAAGDQTTHSKVTQEILHTGKWWQPTNEGRPYYNKPPLKMWLATVPVALLGESEFSYRFIDALAGVGTTLLVFAFALHLFRSRLVAYSAVAALLGCNSFFFGHGVRVATQDAMLLFLCTAATILGWRILEDRAPSGAISRDEKRTALRQALIGGALVGAGVMTKSVAGFMPLVVLALYTLLGGRLRRAWELRGALLATLAVSIAIPAIYIIPHLLFSRTTYRMMFVHEVYKRATKGFHNVDSRYFYLEGIFDDNLTFPPLLLAAALLWSLQYLRDRRIRFLLVWAIAPIAVYSAARSKLFWYIMPSLPALALIIGAFVGHFWWIVVSRIRNRRFERPLVTWQSTAAALVALASLYLLGANLSAILHRISAPPPPNAAAAIANHLRIREAEVGRKPRILISAQPRLARHEYLYFEMFEARKVSGNESLEEEIAAWKPDFVIAQPSALKTISTLSSINAYLSLPPVFRREHWVSLAALGEDFLPPQFHLASKRYSVAREIDPAFGLTPAVAMQHKIARVAREPRAAVLVPGDTVRNRQHTTLRIVAKRTLPEEHGLSVTVLLNGRQVTEFPLRSHEFKVYETQVSPGNWQNGLNLLEFAFTGEALDRHRPSSDRGIAALSEVEVTLIQPFQ